MGAAERYQHDDLLRRLGTLDLAVQQMDRTILLMQEF